MPRSLLPQNFYARDALLVARDLLGQRLVRGRVVLRITEVEAYRHPNDSANHCRAGKTVRNAPMWGPPGHAYVYLCYGIHSMLNMVTNAEGEGAAVLVRSCEPIEGLSIIRRRRKGFDGPALLTGPGKVAAALLLTTAWSGHPLFVPGGLEVRKGDSPRMILVGPRVGIDYADPDGRRAPYRFAAGDSAWVTERKKLKPLA